MPMHPASTAPISFIIFLVSKAGGVGFSTMVMFIAFPAIMVPPF